MPSFSLSPFRAKYSAPISRFHPLPPYFHCLPLSTVRRRPVRGIACGRHAFFRGQAARSREDDDTYFSGRPKGFVNIGTQRAQSRACPDAVVVVTRAKLSIRPPMLFYPHRELCSNSNVAAPASHDVASIGGGDRGVNREVKCGRAVGGPPPHRLVSRPPASSPVGPLKVVSGQKRRQFKIRACARNKRRVITYH